ncbi:MAG: glycosyltransferase family 4 protein [Bacteroidetes bacterium]|nr:glycosyltransferase family 4 protein [Bacteroidota bacterium]
MKFCFWGDISGALKGKTKGGAELQIALLAKALALNGHEVVIVDPYSKESFVTAEGIKLVNIPDWNKGIRGLRFFTNRVSALRKKLEEQKADYYYVRIKSYLHLIAYRACRKVNGKFIIALASHFDTLGIWEKFKNDRKAKFPLWELLSNGIPNYFAYKYLFKKADFIVLQHSGQNVRHQGFKKKNKIFVFPNIIEYKCIPKGKENPANYFVFVGSLTVLKGSINLFKLLGILDESCHIVVVGQPGDKRSKRIVEALCGKTNISFTGRVDHLQALKFISESKALINTSNFEGFPNIFLEAWASGIPVISLNVNPDNIINKNNLGVYCDGDILMMKHCIQTWNTGKFSKENMISYIKKFHDFSTAGERFLENLNAEA